MDSLIRLLSSSLDAAGDQEEIAEALAKVAWRMTAGELLRNHAVPFRLFRQTLIVSVADTIWQKQLQAISGELLFRINSILGRKAIKFVEFRIDPEAVQAARRDRRPERRGAYAEASLSSQPAELIAAAGLIRDETLRNRFLIAARSSIARRGD